MLQIQEPSPCSVGIDLGTTHSIISYIDDQGKIISTPLIPTEIFGITSFKRFMETPYTKIEGGDFSPFELSYHFLCSLKEKAQKQFRRPIYEAVITVPAHFSEIAREATKKAAMQAGFNVLRLINEPTAAIIAYTLSSGHYLVYDFGGGTFDVSFIYAEDDLYHVLKTAGDLYLGGDDIDYTIQQKLNLQSKEIAKTIKEQNTQKTQTIAQQFIDKTILFCKEVMKDCSIKIDSIICVGGSSRLSGVKKSLVQQFNAPVLCEIDPDYVVAFGAARQAKKLSGKEQKDRYTLVDVTPLSLGIETMGGVNEKIIYRNSPIPTRVSKDFTTFVDNQTRIKIHIVQGESEFIKNCRSLKEFVLADIPAQPAGTVKIQVEFFIDVNGVLHASAVEQSQNKKYSIQIYTKFEGEDKDLKKLLLTSSEEIMQRLLHDLKIKGERILHDLAKYNLDQIDDAQELKKALEQNNRQNIQEKIDNLTKAIEPIMAEKIKELLEKSLI